MSAYYVYILECSDKSLNTGWTRDVEKRVREHNTGKTGAKYTKPLRPVKLVYVEEAASLSPYINQMSSIKPKISYPITSFLH
jgi:putative endonuclease